MCFTWREEEDVIQVDEHNLVQHVTKYIIHLHLENSYSICEPKWHYEVLILASEGVKGSFPLIPLPYPQKMISIFKVSHGEDLSTLQ